MKKNSIKLSIKSALFISTLILSTNATADITSNLEANYACQSSLVDSTANGRDLSVNVGGTVTYDSCGRFGPACQFDGATGVKTANSAFTQSNNVSYAFWVKSAIATGQIIIMQTVPGAGVSPVQNSIDHETTPLLRIWSNNPGSPFTFNSTPGIMFDNSWHHVVITSTGTSSTAVMYVDGNLVVDTQAGIDSQLDLQTTLWLGTRSDIAVNGVNDFTGSIDDLKIYSRALSAGDVTELFTDNTAPTPTIAGPTTNQLAAFDVTIDFGEPVTGLTLADITVGNGTASNLIDNCGGDGGNYTVTITPTTDGNVTVDTNVAAANDSNANASIASAQFSVTFGNAVVTPIPTLSFWGLLMLSTLLSIFGMNYKSRKEG
jgi:hypothetical protein